MNDKLGYFACLRNVTRGPRLRRWTLRVLLAGLLALPLRFAALGADPGDAVIKADQVPGMPAATAYGRRISTLIKATWVRSINKLSDDIPLGAVVVHVDIDRHGNATNSHIVSGPAKEILHRLALLAIKDTQLPAMPDDATEELQGGRLHLDITFDAVSG